MKNFIYILVIISVLSGCIKPEQPPVTVSKYTLEYESDIKTYEPSKYSLTIHRFSSSPDYNTKRMIYSEKKYQRQEYAYHMWRSYPADMITYNLTQNMTKSKLFKSVFSDNSVNNGRYEIEGSVDEIYELNNDKGWFGVLTLNITLVDSENGQVLLQKQYKESSVMSKRTPSALADAISVNMNNISKKITEDLSLIIK